MYCTEINRIIDRIYIYTCYIGDSDFDIIFVVYNLDVSGVCLIWCVVTFTFKSYAILDDITEGCTSQFSVPNSKCSISSFILASRSLTVELSSLVSK